MASSLDQAQVHVNALKLISVADEQPNIEAPPLLVVQESLADINFADARAYQLDALPYYTLEAECMAKLRKNVEVGETFLSLVYAYRSISKAVPQVQSTEQANRYEIYTKTYEILKPEINKMKSLMGFCESSVVLVSQIIASVIQQKKETGLFSSEPFVLSLASTFDLFIVMDALKNMKTSLNNDFSMYKRAHSNMSKDVILEDETIENHKLYTFLANHDSFSKALRDSVVKIAGFADFVSETIHVLADIYERGQFVLPKEKHMLLKAMAFGLFLIDSDPDEKNNLLKQRKIKVDRFGKLFKATPVVPLFGDMSTTLVSILRKSTNLDSSKWDMNSEDENVIRNYSVLGALEESRQVFATYSAQFGVIMNELRFHQQNKLALDAVALKNIYTVLLQGLQLLSSWNCLVLEQSAWKFANPTSDILNRECPSDAADYEKVVRYNYNHEERLALVEIIFMIKSLHTMLNRSSVTLAPLIRRHVYNEIQNFIQVNIRALIAHATKKKRSIINVLRHIQLIGSDWLDGMTPDTMSMTVSSTISSGSTRKSSKKETFSLDLPTRDCPISLSQLHFVRVLLDSVYNDKAKGMQGGFMKEKDFKDAQVEEMEEIYKASFFYHYMLDFDNTLREAADLSELWYKEFYLEVSKRIQFPIEMSLPWILADHILESDANEMLENLFFVFDIYNDAAYQALHKLRVRFLYDEIEAEVNLVFDQFVFKLSQKLFAHFKVQASCLVLQKDFKTILQQIISFEVPRGRFSALLAQRHVQILGRSIDFKMLLTQAANRFIANCIDVATSRYEASDLSAVIEYSTLIENARICHTLLSKHFTLDPFEDIFLANDEGVSLVTFNGRFVSHTISELINDIIPNMCYNSISERFIRTPLPLTEAIPRPNLPKVMHSTLFGAKHLYAAFNAVHSLYANFIGPPHFQTLVRLLGKKNIAIIFNELLKNAELLIVNTLTPYVSALAKGMPHSSKLPPFEYGCKGTFDYFQLILKPLLTYRDLKSEVFQSFREIGNTLIVVNALEKAMAVETSLDWIQSSSFLLNQSDGSVVDSKLVLNSVMESVNNVLASTQPTLAEKSTALIGPTVKKTLVGAFLRQVTQILKPLQKEWIGAAPSNGILNIDSTLEFYRIWSAIQFAICIPPINASEYTTRELFGEGLQWAGISLIYLLGQRHRFEVFDFSYHLLNVRNVEKYTDKAKESMNVGGLDVRKFFELADFNRAINDDIFALCKVALPNDESRFGLFYPPETEGAEGVYVAFEGEHPTANM